jgi:hypothetical protein
MTQSKTGDEAIYRLIRQGIDDVRFQLGSAQSMMELHGVLTEETLGRITRAVTQYEQSQTEFAIQLNDMSARRQLIVEQDLVDVWKKLWFVMAGVSRMAKGNPVFYNRLRDLRLKLMIPGGLFEQRAQAAGGG